MDLNFQGLLQSQKIDDEESKKYLTQGVGRRLDVLKRCLERVFELFPSDQERALGRVVLTDVQIYLHAFVMNLFGIFDNWAWAFLHRHDLSDEIGGREKLGLFKRAPQRYLPTRNKMA